MLQSDDDLLVARLVIPELRPNTTAPQNSSKQEVLRRVNPFRPSLAYLEPGRQAGFDQTQPLYAEEKRTFQEAEMYRAFILLYNCSNLDEAERKQVQEKSSLVLRPLCIHYFLIEAVLVTSDAEAP